LNVRERQVYRKERGWKGDCWLHTWSTLLLKISTSSFLPIISTACHVRMRVVTFLGREASSLMTISLLDFCLENALLWNAKADPSLYISLMTRKQHNVIFLLRVLDSNLEDWLSLIKILLICSLPSGMCWCMIYFQMLYNPSFTFFIIVLSFTKLFM
jgi:hypothetical protein